MEELRFRNHFTVILEKMGGFFLVILLLAFQNIKELVDWANDPEGLKALSDSPDAGWMTLLIPAGLLLVVVLVVGVHVLVWSKTWITITDTTIVMEVNTLRKTCNTIGMKNISNVNIEQNLWEKILGTCKIKLDTSSLSTANQTDVKIVLKRKEALRTQKEILQRVYLMQHAADASKTPDTADNMEEENPFDVVATIRDIAMHGVCSASILSILALLGCIGEFVVVLGGMRDISFENITVILANIVIIGGIIIVCLKGVFGGFITFYDFKVGRRGDKLYVHYGMLRTIDYTIPVKQISGVNIKQTLIGRLLKRYMVELINVGMGDEEKESGSYIVLACNKSQLEEQMRLLLPEYADMGIECIKKQPVAVFWNKLAKTLTGITVFAFASLIVVELVPEVENWIVVLICSICIAFGILLAFLQYFTAGTYFGKDKLLVANGNFTRYITIVPYKNVQYIELHTNGILAHFGLVKGSVHLLAGMANQEKGIPACKSDVLENVVQNFLKI